MRISLGTLLALAVAAPTALVASGCAPSAMVRKASPVADLTVYRKVLVRGKSGQAAWQGEELANRTAAQLQAMCGFDAVFTGGANAAGGGNDLVVDLNILASNRGGDGILKNPNLAVVEVAMVLSDGINDELLGSAQIRGQSSAVVINSASPEQQALHVVSQEIGKILVKSGCTGPRIARADPTPEETAPPKAEKPEVTEEQITEAEEANNRGKELFRAAQVSEARDAFARAIELNPDPRYIMNLCLAHEALKDWDTAIQTCEDVIAARPDERLQKKAEQRIILISDKKKNAS